MFPLTRHLLHLKPSIEGQIESKVKSAKANNCTLCSHLMNSELMLYFNLCKFPFLLQQKQGQQKGEKDIGTFQKSSILQIDVYPAAEHSTISSASIKSNLILIQCLTNEADQDLSNVTSWLKHAESCNIHSHQRTEEWKQSH